MAAAAISRARSSAPSFSSATSLLAALFSNATTSCSSTTSQLCSPFAQIRSASTQSDATVSKDSSRRLHRYSYIVAPDQLQAGMKVMNFDAGAATSSSGWKLGMLDPLSQVGNCMPLGDMRIGTFVHCVEFRPGEGAKFVRAAGTSAKIMRLGDGQCVLKMPSGCEKVFDARCKATIGRVSNPERKHMKLRKAGQARWLGMRPVVGNEPRGSPPRRR